MHLNVSAPYSVPNFMSGFMPHNYSLSDFLFRAIPSRIVHALREVLDESYPLGNADLLLLRKLSGQSGLAGCRVVDGHVDLLLRREKKWGRMLVVGSYRVLHRKR